MIFWFDYFQLMKTITKRCQELDLLMEKKTAKWTDIIEANLQANDWEFLKTKWKTETRFRKNLLYNGSANFLTRFQT